MKLECDIIGYLGYYGKLGRHLNISLVAYINYGSEEQRICVGTIG